MEQAIGEALEELDQVSNGYYRIAEIMSSISVPPDHFVKSSAVEDHTKENVKEI